MGFWTFEHTVTVIPTFILFVLFSFLMRRLLLKSSYAVRILPIRIIAVILVLIEIGKQICSFSIGYNLYHIPLHFCSIFLYVLPLMAFYKGKYEEHVRSVATSTMTALFIGMLIIPNVIYGGDRVSAFFTDYLSFHTVFFHNLVILALMLCFALDLHKPRVSKGENIFITIFGTVFVAIAATASHLLQTNYSNFLYTTVGPIKLLVEEIKVALGEGVTTVIYTVSLALLHVLLILLTNVIFYLVCVAKERMKERAERKKRVNVN